MCRRPLRGAHTQIESDSEDVTADIESEHDSQRNKDAGSPWTGNLMDILGLDNAVDDGAVDDDADGRHADAVLGPPVQTVDPALGVAAGVNLQQGDKVVK